MIDDETKIKYKNISRRLSIISKKTSDLNQELFYLEQKLKKSMLIDNNICAADKLKIVKKDLSAVSKTIKGDIISSINRKIYS